VELSTLQSGFPVAVSRPSVVSGNAQLAHPTISQWFNTSVVSAAPAFTYGNQGPYLRGVRTDPIRNFDTTFVKKFPFEVRNHAFTGPVAC